MRFLNYTTIVLHNISQKLLTFELSSVHWLSLSLRKHEADVVPGVAVQALLQPLLVQEVADEADAAAEDEETVK